MPRPPEKQLWRVVGGEDKGGILVREGRELKSPACSDRLSFGAICSELQLTNGRLNYDLVDGAGPKVGWVSLTMNDKALVIRIANEEPAEEVSEGLDSVEVPAHLKPACDLCTGRLPLKPVAALAKFVPASSMKDAKERAKLQRDGDMYGLPIPRTPQEFESEAFGADWLTRVFHAAGSLPDDNSVARIASAQNFPGGGSGPKTLFTVEYTRPDPSLDTVLFMKLPAEVGATGSGVSSAQQRVQDMMGAFGDIWGAEIQFYRFVSPSMPFAVPRFYFGDLSRESHEACLITTAVEWPSRDKMRFGAYDLLPPCEKCEDYTLRSSQDYYFALLKCLGQLSGLSKVGKLGSEFDKIHWSEYGPNPRGLSDGLAPQLKSFVQDVSPSIWSAKVKSRKFMDFLDGFVPMVETCAVPIDQFLYSDPLYVGFAHQNGNTDNAYFYRNAAGGMEAGVFDWGSAGHMAYAAQFMGAFGSCLGEMLAEYDDRLVRAFADAYHSTGAPALDVEELTLHFRLAISVGVCQMIPMVLPFLSEKHPQGRPFWKGVKVYNDDKIRNVFALKFGISMLYNRLTLLSLRGDVYLDSLKAWRKRKGLD